MEQLWRNIWISVPGLTVFAYLAGVLLYARLPILRRLLIPRALISGIILLLLGPEVLNIVGDAPYAAWKKWPGFLISLLFAGLVLGGSTAKSAGAALPVVQQSLYVWFLALGQLAVGFVCALFIIVPLGGNPLVAHILEIGWVGGHGSAAAMTGVMEKLGHREIGDLSIFSATAGLLLGGAAGIILVNFLRNRHRRDIDAQTAANFPDKDKGEGDSANTTGIAVKSADNESELGGRLYLALAMIMLCVFLAYLFLEISSMFTAHLGYKGTSEFLRDFPLFSLALLFAIPLRALGRTGQNGFMNEAFAHEVNRISAVVLDLLIIAAVATLKLTAFAEHLGTFAIMMTAGITFCVFTVLVIARRMLPEKLWLELGVMNFGMSTGVTALGLVFVKSLKGRIGSEAARVYGLAAPFSAPLIGGGLISFLLPRLTNEGYGFAILAALVLALGVLFGLGVLLDRISRS